MKILTDQAYDNKTLKRTQIYTIIKGSKQEKNMADQRQSNTKKNRHTEHIVAAVVAAVEEDSRQVILGLTSVLGQR
jgi:hypothetical protein